MKVFRSKGQFLCVIMAVLMLLVSFPSQPVSAALINTETLMNATADDAGRSQIKQFLSRKDVQRVLTARGIDPLEAEKRVDSLSNDEVNRISDRLDQLPAGGGAVEFLLVVILVTFLVLVILDLSGVTDVFTFIKSQK